VDGVTLQPRPGGSGDTAGARLGLVADVGGARLRAVNAALQAVASSVEELHAHGRPKATPAEGREGGAICVWRGDQQMGLPQK
jgi:hypothetical protein